MNNKNFMSPKEQKIFHQKKENFKLALTLCLTNFLTFSLCQFLSEEAQPLVERSVQLEKDHLWVQGQLELFVPFKDKTLTPVTLLNNQGEVVIQKAYLYEKSLDDKESSWEASTTGALYKIQIPTPKMDVFIKNSSKALMAYPFYEKKPALLTQQKSKETKKRAYELHF